MDPVLVQSLIYVTEAPYFWLTVGATISTFMFIGAILFDGDLSVASKSMIALGAYVFFLLQTQFARVNDTLVNKDIIHSPAYLAHAANITILLFTVFCIAGILLGVFISFLVHRGHKHKHA